MSRGIIPWLHTRAHKRPQARNRAKECPSVGRLNSGPVDIPGVIIGSEYSRLFQSLFLESRKLILNKKKMLEKARVR